MSPPRILSRLSLYGLAGLAAVHAVAARARGTASAPACCSATRWRPSACCRARGIIARTLAAAAAAGRAWPSSRPKRRARASTTAWALVGVFAVFLALGTAVTWARSARCRGRACRSWRSPSATSARRAGSRARSCCRSAPASRCSSPWRSSTRSIVSELHRAPAGRDRPTTSCSTCKRADYRRLHRRWSQREVPAAKVREAPDAARAPRQARRPPVEDIKAPPEAQWVLNGDRGLTYSRDGARGLERGRGRVVAGRLLRRAARLLRGRDRQGRSA